jgi:hypothetical protein
VAPNEKRRSQVVEEEISEPETLNPLASSISAIPLIPLPPIPIK